MWAGKIVSDSTKDIHAIQKAAQNVLLVDALLQRYRIWLYIFKYYCVAEETITGFVFREICFKFMLLYNPVEKKSPCIIWQFLKVHVYMQDHIYTVVLCCKSFFLGNILTVVPCSFSETYSIVLDHDT